MTNVLHYYKYDEYNFLLWLRYFVFSLISLNSVYVYCLDNRRHSGDAASSHHLKADAHHRDTVDSERRPF